MSKNSASDAKGSRGRPPVKISKTELTVNGCTALATEGTRDPDNWVLEQASTVENTPGLQARILFPNGNSLQRILLMYRDMYDTVDMRIVNDAAYITHLETEDNSLVSLVCTKISKDMLPEGYFYYKLSEEQAPFGVSFTMSMLSIKDVCSQMSKNPVEFVVIAGKTDTIQINMFSPGAMTKKGVTFSADKAINVIDTEGYLDIDRIMAPKIAEASLSSKSFCTEVPFCKTSRPDDRLVIALSGNKITFETKFKTNKVSVDFFVDKHLVSTPYCESVPSKETQSFIRGSAKLNIGVEFHFYEQIIVIRYKIPDIGETIFIQYQKRD